MPGCGTFSHYDLGSFVLFPNFTLRLYDSYYDNLIGFKSIERSTCNRLNYAEPRATRASAKAAILVPPDNEYVIGDSNAASAALLTKSNAYDDSGIDSSNSQSRPEGTLQGQTGGSDSGLLWIATKK